MSISDLEQNLEAGGPNTHGTQFSFDYVLLREQLISEPYVRRLEYEVKICGYNGDCSTGTTPLRYAVPAHTNTNPKTGLNADNTA